LRASGAGNRKAAHRGGIPGRLGFGLLIPRIERFHAQGTVASPARLPDSDDFRITPDAMFYYPQFALWVNTKVDFVSPPAFRF
jgi:hypothetical protein